MGQSLSGRLHLHGGDRYLLRECRPFFFAGEGFTVSVVNPAQIKAYDASRLTCSKTAAVEARRYTEPFGLARCRNKTFH